MIITLALGLAACNDAGAQDDAGVAPPTSTDYCNCLLVECHEPFHEMFGVSDADALRNCAVAAEDAMTAGTFECRVNTCMDANDDPAMCAAALGAPPCD